MKQPPRQRPFKDERDEQIETNAKSYALEWVTAVTQILTIICIAKGNPAWKGTLSILFFAVAFALFYQLLDGELRETQTTDYFSKHRRSDCAVRELTAR